MSHIHLPDGILPVWLWLAGYLLTALLIAVLSRRGQATAEPRRFALLGVFSAMMVLVMMLEIPPFSSHFNLSVMSGIIIGPQLAVLAALIVNLILALVGHGGLTVVGLNTLVLSTEMLVGYYTFRLLARGDRPTMAAAFGATFVGLAAGTAASYGLIAAGSPWIDEMMRSARLSPGERLELSVSGAHLDLARLALIMFGAGVIGWLLESILSSAALVYLEKAFPGLVGKRG